MAPQSKGKKKEERIEFRVDPETKSLLQTAADLSGQSLSDYVRTHAVQNASEDIASLRQITLSQRDWKLFCQILDSTPPIKEEIAATLSPTPYTPTENYGS